MWHRGERMTDNPNRPRNTNQLAKAIVNLATDEASDETAPKAEAQRKGGLKGGAARAQSLSPEQRADIARTAAEAHPYS